MVVEGGAGRPGGGGRGCGKAWWRWKGMWGMRRWGKYWGGGSLELGDGGRTGDGGRSANYR